MESNLLNSMAAEEWLTEMCERVAPGQNMAQRIIARQEAKGRELGRIMEAMVPEVVRVLQEK